MSLTRNGVNVVVTIENINQTLAGSLGIKTKVILPKNCYWTDGIKDKKSYWFPSVSLFRQTNDDEWTEALSQIRKEVLQ